MAVGVCVAVSPVVSVGFANFGGIVVILWVLLPYALLSLFWRLKWTRKLYWIAIAASVVTYDLYNHYLVFFGPPSIEDFKVIFQVFNYLWVLLAGILGNLLLCTAERWATKR